MTQLPGQGTQTSERVTLYFPGSLRNPQSRSPRNGDFLQLGMIIPWLGIRGGCGPLARVQGTVRFTAVIGTCQQNLFLSRAHERR